MGCRQCAGCGRLLQRVLRMRSRPMSAHARRDEELRAEVRRIHECPGAPTGCLECMRSFRRWMSSEPQRVARLMRETGLAGVNRRRGSRTHACGSEPAFGPGPGRAPLPGRGAESPVGCRRDLRANLGGIFVLGDRARCVQPACRGWSMANHLRTELVLNALNMALARRRPSCRPSLRQRLAIHIARLRQSVPGDGSGHLDRDGW